MTSNEFSCSRDVALFLPFSCNQSLLAGAPLKLRITNRSCGTIS
jgi:hypothetical protein